MNLKKKQTPRKIFFGLFFEEMNENNENDDAIFTTDYILLSLYMYGKQYFRSCYICTQYKR